MTRLLHTLGRSSASHPGRVLLGWLVVLVALGSLAGFGGGAFRDVMTAPDSSSGRAAAILASEFPEASGAGAHVVARWEDDVDAPSVARSRQEIESLAGVAAVTERTGEEGDTVLLSATFTAELADVDLAATTDALTAAGRPMAGAGALVAVGGQIPEAIQGPNGTAEAIGVGVALIVLLVAFRSVVAAGLPLLVAVLGVGTGMCLIVVLAAVTDVSTVSPTLGMMMGLGVGIDYALFVVARHRENLLGGMSPIDAASRATATAGRSVVVAGTIVLVAIGGLFFAGVPGFATLGLAAALVVLACVAAAITALPAMLGRLGTRVLPRRATQHADRAAFRSERAARIAAAVTRRPTFWLITSVVSLLALAAPALGMRLGQNDAGSERVDAPTRVAFDLVADAFGPGVNGPLTVVAPAGRVDDTTAVLADDAGVAEVAPAVFSADGATAVLAAIPTTGPSEEATFDLVGRLHAALPRGVEVTGATAAMVDTTAVLGAHLWQVVTAVLVATYILMVVLMRSLVVPAKAVVANLLSVGAAYGVLTVAFQTEAGAALIGLPGPVPIPGWAPVVLFGILFGLSMDYEIFMMSRVREHYLRCGDTAASVVDGLAATAKIMTFAGAIIVSVALGFALDPGVMVKIIGVGIAAAIVVDVTVVRLVLVPAALALLGSANWYLPRFLQGRRSPHVEISAEGTDVSVISAQDVTSAR